MLKRGPVKVTVYEYEEYRPLFISVHHIVLACRTDRSGDSDSIGQARTNQLSSHSAIEAADLMKPNGSGSLNGVSGKFIVSLLTSTTP